MNERRAILAIQRTLIAQADGITVGFGSIDSSGYLDLLYVHKDYQRIGIATALCNHLEQGFKIISTHSSITAKPFFEKRGYSVVKSHTATCNNCELINFYMVKNKRPAP